jgi:hypothetical protein
MIVKTLQFAAHIMIQLSRALPRITIYDSLKILAAGKYNCTFITIVKYDRRTFVVQSTREQIFMSVSYMRKMCMMSTTGVNVI